MVEVDSNSPATGGPGGLVDRPRMFWGLVSNLEAALFAQVPSCVQCTSPLPPTAVLTQFKPLLASYLGYFHHLNEPTCRQLW